MPSTAADIAKAYGIGHDLAAKIVSVSQRVGIADPAMLANAINWETGGSFSPSERNPFSGATGLIQFMPNTTAYEVGTTAAQLANMTAVQQMDYVQRYFELDRVRRGCGGASGCSGEHRFGPGNPLKTQLDVYMAIFYPPAIGKGPNWSFPKQVWVSNPGTFTPGHYQRKADAFAKLGVSVRNLVLGGVIAATLLGGGFLFWLSVKKQEQRAASNNPWLLE